MFLIIILNVINGRSFRSLWWLAAATGKERSKSVAAISEMFRLKLNLALFFCERFFYLHMEFITSSTVSSFICFFPVTEGSRRVLAMTELWRVAFLRYFRAALLPIDAFLSSHGSFSFQTKYKELFGNYYFWNYLNVQYRMFNIWNITRSLLI